jgi:phospholipid/cholesterol/gamma-HCH transport system ATP-binding protein
MGRSRAIPPHLRAERETVIAVRDISVGFGDTLDLEVYRGEVLGVVGASGTGKSVLLRAIVGLLPLRAGTVELFGRESATLSKAERSLLEQNWGVLFQDGALFSSLTVLQNIQVPMREHLDLPQRLMDELGWLKIAMVGLPMEAADKYPSELSGGMRKRAGLARALALDPEIVFLDEPTAGLDPIGAADFDDLIAKLQQTLGLTVFMVTHDLDSLYAICDRIAVLGDKHVLVTGDVRDMLDFDHPWVRAYFQGPRARAVNA